MIATLCISILFCFKITASNPLTLNSLEFVQVNQTAAPNSGNQQNAAIGAKRCMKDIKVCFEITSDFFHLLYRPLNFLPQDRSTIDTRFNLYTKLHPKEPHLLNINWPEEIKESPLDPRHEIKFIVHGFFDNTLYGKWMETLKDNLLLHDDYNVIIVDWSKGNGLPYTQASANARVVGVEIELLIKSLEKLLGVSPMNCHIIGHSLGSHIAGYAGERLKNLGRITALDPAQPYFQNMPPSVRIDPTDADFVDVIHTDSSSSKFLPLGMSQAVGHVDFYPNNGMSQPGCTYSSINSIFLEGLVDAVRQYVACNHQRSVDYFIHSINYKKALPVAYNCIKYQDYLDGYCSDCGRNGQKCAIMGLQAHQYRPFKNDSKSVKMYLMTAGSTPFWVYSYQITLKLAKPEEGYRDRPGTVYLQIIGSKTDYSVTLSTKTEELIHGASYSFLFTEKKELGNIKSIIFSWVSRQWSIFTKHTIYLDYVKMTPLNIIDKGEREKNTKKFCSISNKPIISKYKQPLSECH